MADAQNSQQRSTPATLESVSLKDITKLLGISDRTETATTDACRVVQSSKSIPEDHIARALGFLESEHYALWRDPDKSTMLIVNGCFRDAKYYEVSPMSVLSHVVKQQLVSSHGTAGDIILQYFCGLHLDPSDPLCGATGLLMCTIAQMTTWIVRAMGSIGANARALPVELDLEGVRRRDLTALKSLWKCLYAKLPEVMTLSLIIDNIYVFETHASQKRGTVDNWLDCCSFFTQLVEERNRRVRGPKINILLTTSKKPTQRSRQAYTVSYRELDTRKSNDKAARHFIERRDEAKDKTVEPESTAFDDYVEALMKAWSP